MEWKPAVSSTLFFRLIIKLLVFFITRGYVAVATTWRFQSFALYPLGAWLIFTSLDYVNHIGILLHERRSILHWWKSCGGILKQNTTLR
jgi:hypothetical protein